MQTHIIKDNKHNEYFNSQLGLGSHPVLYIIPLHELTLFIKITLSVDLCVCLICVHFYVNMNILFSFLNR